MDHTIPTIGSPLAEKLQELIDSGVVVVNPWSPDTFPTARVVVPVYDSSGTFMPVPSKEPNKNAQLARNT